MRHINGIKIAIIIEIEESGFVCLETWGIEIVAVEEEICGVCVLRHGELKVLQLQEGIVFCVIWDYLILKNETAVEEEFCDSVCFFGDIQPTICSRRILWVICAIWETFLNGKVSEV